MFASLCSTAEMAPLVMFIQVTDKDRTPPKLDPHLWRSLISNSKRSGRNPKKYKKENIDSEKKNAQKAVLQIAVSKNATLATCSWSSNGYNNQRSPGADSNDSNEHHTSQSQTIKLIHSETRPKLRTPSSPSVENSGFPPCYEGFRATLRSPERHWGGDAPRSRRSDGWARWNAYIDPWPHRGDEGWIKKASPCWSILHFSQSDKHM